MCRRRAVSAPTSAMAVLGVAVEAVPWLHLPLQIKTRARGGLFDFLQPEWNNVSKPCKDLIRKLLVRNPQASAACAVMALPVLLA